MFLGGSYCPAKPRGNAFFGDAFKKIINLMRCESAALVLLLAGFILANGEEKIDAFEGPAGSRAHLSPRAKVIIAALLSPQQKVVEIEMGSQAILGEAMGGHSRECRANPALCREAFIKGYAFAKQEGGVVPQPGGKNRLLKLRPDDKSEAQRGSAKTLWEGAFNLTSGRKVPLSDGEPMTKGHRMEGCLTQVKVQQTVQSTKMVKTPMVSSPVIIIPCQNACRHCTLPHCTLPRVADLHQLP